MSLQTAQTLQTLFADLALHASPLAHLGPLPDAVPAADTAPLTEGLRVVAAPDYDPSGSNAPGRAVAQELLNTVAFFCTLVALAAFALGAATWGIGGRIMHSSHGAAAGKMTMLAAVGGAILLGAGPAIIAWALALGGRA